MLKADSVRNADWDTVEASAKGPKGDQYPCLVCGRGATRNAVYVRLHGGGNNIVTEAEANQRNAEGGEPGDMGAYPVGRDCLRKHPELLPYVMAADAW